MDHRLLNLTGSTMKDTWCEGSGPIVLIVHGGPGMDFSYMRNGLSPLARDYQLIYYEQSPQRGESHANVSAADQVAELEAISEQLSATDPIRMLAHSWGTFLAIELGIRRPGLISHLALLNPVPLDWDRFATAGSRLVDRVLPEHLSEVERLEAEGTEDAGLALMNLVSYAYLAPRNSDIRPHFDRYNPSVNAHILSTVEGYNHVPYLSKLSAMDITTILGQQDYLLPEDTTELRNLARTQIVDDCGHFPFDEQPGRLRSTLLAALA